MATDERNSMTKLVMPIEWVSAFLCCSQAANPTCNAQGPRQAEILNHWRCCHRVYHSYSTRARGCDALSKAASSQEPDRLCQHMFRQNVPRVLQLSKLVRLTIAAVWEQQAAKPSLHPNPPVDPGTERADSINDSMKHITNQPATTYSLTAWALACQNAVS